MVGRSEVAMLHVSKTLDLAETISENLKGVVGRILFQVLEQMM